MADDGHPDEIAGLARRLARSGHFGGWRLIAVELRFIRGLREAAAWFEDGAVREEIDALCRAAQRRRSRRLGQAPAHPPVPRFNWSAAGVAVPGAPDL